MEFEDDGFLGLPYAHDHPTAFSVMPRYVSQESNFGALYLDHGPWITQNMDMAQPPPKAAHPSSATQSSKFESALSSHSRPPTFPTSSRVKIPLPSIRRRTAQACDKCRERKTKCSGHHPCLRCKNRGLACEYSTRETRLRLPTRSRFHPGDIRPKTDPETDMQQFYPVNYQPPAATHSRMGNDPPLVGVYEPTPVYAGHATMDFSNLNWDGYQQGPFVYEDPAVVTAPPFNLSQVDLTSNPVNYFIV